MEYIKPEYIYSYFKSFLFIIIIGVSLNLNIFSSAEFFDLPQAKYDNYIFVWGNIEYGSSFSSDLEALFRKSRTVLRYSWRDRWWFNRKRYLKMVLVIPKKKYFEFDAEGFKKLKNLIFKFRMSRRTNIGRGIFLGPVFLGTEHTIKFSNSEFKKAFIEIAPLYIKKPFDTFIKKFPDEIKILEKRPDNILKQDEIGYGFLFSFEILTSVKGKKIRLYREIKTKEIKRYR